MVRIEYESLKHNLEMHKHITESIVNMTKSSLRLSKMLAMLLVPVLILLSYLGVRYLLEGDIFFGILEIALAALNMGLFIDSLRRWKSCKRALAFEEADFERSVRLLEELEEIENELENGEIQ